MNATGEAAVHPALIVPDSQTALGVVRSLAARGVPCAVGAWNALGPAQYSRYARAVACPSPSAGRAFIDGLIAIRRSFSTRPVLFVTDESSMLMIDRAREELAPHYFLTVPASAHLARWVSKPCLYEFSAAAGVPTPATWVLEGDRVPPGIDYPIVVKPAQRVIWIGDYALRSFRRDFGCKAVLAQTAAQARAIVTRAHTRGFQMLLQQLVPGDVSNLLTAGVFAGSDGTRALFTARKLAQVPPDFGDGSVVEGVTLPELAPPAWRLVDHAGFVGVADMEFKRDAGDGQLKLLDINPRPWLWIELATRCGVNLPYLAYCEAVCRRNTQDTPQQSVASLRWCSTRALLRTLLRSDATARRAALVAIFQDRRRIDVGATVARGDSLWRMWLNPRFWRHALRATRHDASGP